MTCFLSETWNLTQPWWWVPWRVLSVKRICKSSEFKSLMIAWRLPIFMLDMSSSEWFFSRDNFILFLLMLKKWHSIIYQINQISLYFLAASKGSSSSSFFLWWNSELSTQATEANATEVSQPEELEDQPAWLHMYTYHAWWSIKNKPFLLHSVPSWPDNALWAVCY